jgi:hypothetical protein
MSQTHGKFTYIVENSQPQISNGDKHLENQTSCNCGEPSVSLSIKLNLNVTSTFNLFNSLCIIVF